MTLFFLGCAVVSGLAAIFGYRPKSEITVAKGNNLLIRRVTASGTLITKKGFKSWYH